MSCATMLNTTKLFRRGIALATKTQSNRHVGKFNQPPQKLWKETNLSICSGRGRIIPFAQLSRELSKQPLRLKKMPTDYPLLTGSDHWKRKIRTMFKAVDTTGQGYITKESMELTAKRAAQYLDLNEEQAENHMNLRLDIWRKFVSRGSDDNIRTSENEFVQNHLLTFNDSKIRENLADYLAVEFISIDADADGYISPREHAAYFYGIGIPTEYSKPMFDIMDTNKDGLISQEEFQQAQEEFWLTEDENNIYNEFHGPLVD
ncbi:sarcoplasmic calcium-binding protein-like [Lingula anatina]|uniref:Sarcoplasmic calcium-binding protein-like n=1 Tax=Lingula anatina TaxID=7574 RepID=A0A1S3HPB3_LINAN|nr:sarcoplasmic calcium-binding protein-like [Lingula anatina]|eukprot:XP_013387381.1 sarcoplasmic calcium-binding protein-like [Lingula anatina]